MFEKENQTTFCQACIRNPVKRDLLAFTLQISGNFITNLPITPNIQVFQRVVQVFLIG